MSLTFILSFSADKSAGFLPLKSVTGLSVLMEDFAVDLDEVVLLETGFVRSGFAGGSGWDGRILTGRTRWSPSVIFQFYMGY